MELSTERLRLISLTVDQLRCYIPAPEDLEQELGFRVSRDIVTDRLRRAIAMKLAKMQRADPLEHDWYTYWLIVVKNRMYGAGLVGFKGLPDEEGKTEIGYGIDPAYRNTGYTTEAVKGLIGWAFQHPACNTVIAPDTKKVNVASNRVLEKAGMHVYNETEDAFDWKIDKVVWESVA